MKFTRIIVAFTVALCLVAAKTDNTIDRNQDIETGNPEMDYEFNPLDIVDNINDNSNREIWENIYSVIRIVLSTINGVKCTTKESDKIKVASEVFLEAIKICDDVNSYKVSKLIQIAKGIVSTSGDIKEVNENICHYTKTNEEKSIKLPNIKTPVKCFSKLLFLSIDLQNHMNAAGLLIKLISNNSNETSKCVVTAANSFDTVLNTYEESLRNCSQVLP